jgi:hypothetical protein
VFQLADATIAHQFARQAKSGITPLLAAGLQDTARFSGLLDEMFAFLNSQSQRLFAINIFTGPHGGRGHKRMPVVDGPAQYDVEILKRHDVAKIPERFGIWPLLSGDRQMCVIDIADRNDIPKLRCLVPDSAAPSATTDESHRRSVVCRFDCSGLWIGKAFLEEPIRQ